MALCFITMPPRKYMIKNDLAVPHPVASTPLRQNNVNRPASISYFKLVVGMARGGVFGADQSNFINVFPLVKGMADHFIGHTAGNLCSNPTRPLSTSLVDHARTAFAGLLGYGMATAHAENCGAVWFAHFEEAKHRTSVTPPAGTSPPNTPDLISLNIHGILQWLECKGSFAVNSDIWTEKVTGPYRLQVSPWIDGTVNRSPVHRGCVIGTHLSSSETTVSSIFTERKPRAVHLMPAFPTAIILPHYARWLSLFGSVMWPLKRQLTKRRKVSQLRSVAIQLGRVQLGSHTFVTSLPQMPYCQTPCFEGQPIFLGIRLDLLTSLVRFSRDPELTDLVAEEFSQLFTDGEGTETLAVQARELGYENFCSFSDHTIAFTASNLLFEQEGQDFSFDINYDESIDSEDEE